MAVISTSNCPIFSLSNKKIDPNTLTKTIDQMIEIKMLKTPDFENNQVFHDLKRTNRESQLSLLVYPETCKDFETFKNKVKDSKSLEIISNIPYINYFCEDILQHIKYI